MPSCHHVLMLVRRCWTPRMVHWRSLPTHTKWYMSHMPTADALLDARLGWCPCVNPHVIIYAQTTCPTPSGSGTHSNSQSSLCYIISMLYVMLHGIHVGHVWPYVRATTSSISGHHKGHPLWMYRHKVRHRMSCVRIDALL